MKLMNKIVPSAIAASLLVTLVGCGGGGGSSTPTITPTPEENTTVTTTARITGLEASVTTMTATYAGQTALTKQDVSGTYTTDQHWTADKVWRLNGKVLITNGATLTIDPGTVIIGKAGTGANSSWLAIDKDSKIMAQGTADKHIVFTSETAFDGAPGAVGQWGSLVIVGNAAMDSQVGPYEVDETLVPGTNVADDNSGILTYVDVLNSGITIEENKELNGLSLVAVGSGTKIENIMVDKSDDDCIEVWGGTVNMKNISVSECTDDQFDIDDGYSGTVENLHIKQTTGFSGMEMSGNTVATFKGVYIDVLPTATDAAAALYFKKDGIGGHFENVFINYPSSINTGIAAIHVDGAFDSAHTSFTNVHIADSNATKVTGLAASVTTMETLFNGQTALTKVDKSGTIASDETWTADNVYRLNGKVLVASGATLTIEPGTTVIGKAGTGANSSWLAIDAGAKIMAEGTAAAPIVFTSETAFDGADAAVGQWGSLVVVGNAAMDTQVGPYEVDETLIPGTNVANDDSGVLSNVRVLNSGITIEENKELNGLSLVAVGNGTTIDNILVDKSDDDCIETWGGTVNMTNISVSECTDDQFDVDDGYAGTVESLYIKQTTGFSGMEMSGNTVPTYKGVYIDVLPTVTDAAAALYFKKDGIGGHFENVLVNYPVNTGIGSIHVDGAYDASNTTFTNVLVSDEI